MLGTLHRRLDLARPDVLATLEQHWVALLGPDGIAAQCRVESVPPTAWWLVVDDPAVAEHLRDGASKELLTGLEPLCGGPVRPGCAKVAR